MRLACNSYSFHKMFYREDINHFEWLELCAKQLEVDGVELVFDLLPSTEKAFLDETAKAAKDLGLEICCVSPGSNFGYRSQYELEADIRSIRRWIDIACYLEAPMVRIYAGAPYNGDKEGLWPQMIACLKEVTRHAGAQGRLLVLENSGKTTFAADSTDVKRIMRDVGSKALAPLLDTGNFYDGMTSVKEIAPMAGMVHAKFRNPREDGSDEKVDYEEIVPLLMNSGFDGYMSIEFEAEEEMKYVPRVAEYLSRLLDRFGVRSHGVVI
ncbi:MAG: sugar phosphate isomerase/epimerase [Armatimonadetes bacterium]|nr:sugar phosphate isomerase/epimerase [Armatimonadota bacterium]